MSKLGNIRPKDVIRALEKCGFIRVKTVGSQAGISIDELKHAMK